jgi:hypothetical protein
VSYIDDLGKELPAGRYFVVIPEMKPCKSCGGAQIATLSTGPNGYACSGGFKHTDQCPEVVCPHGVRWGRLCKPCNAVARQER